MMRACLALCPLLALAVATPAAAPAPAPAAAPAAAPARAGYEREIPATDYNQVPKLVGYIINADFLAAQKNRAKLVTKWRGDEAVASDNVVLESNVVKIVKPRAPGLVRRRRGYNLQHVNVPARYPYLAVPRYHRYQRWG